MSDVTAIAPEMGKSELASMFPAEAFPGLDLAREPARLSPARLSGDGDLTLAVDPSKKAAAIKAVVEDPLTKKLQKEGLMGPLGHGQFKPSPESKAVVAQNNGLAERHMRSVYRHAPPSRRLGQTRQPQAYNALNLEARRAKARRIYAKIKALETFSNTSSMSVNPAPLPPTNPLRRRFDQALRSASGGPAASPAAKPVQRISANPRRPATSPAARPTARRSKKPLLQLACG